MIRPTERNPNPILTLPTVRLTALLVYVNRNGNIEEREGDSMGRVVNEDRVTAVSEGAVWVLQNGDVVQVYPRERVRGHSLVLSTIDRSTMLIAGFEAGILGVSRAMRYATERVLTDLEAFHGLVTLSDSALDHAIGNNLKEPVSVRQHHENIAELEALVRSGGVLADEIRGFLEKIRDPRDRNKRHNVYRMVLITRAVQRRAKEITEGKGDTLEAVTVIGLDVARYVGAVTATAAQIITELSDEQPWWVGQDLTRTLPSERQLQRNFAARLRRYRTELAAITAKPFRVWTERASDAIGVMVEGIESHNGQRMLKNAKIAVASLQAVLVREGISRCITMTTRRDDDGTEPNAKWDAEDILYKLVLPWYMTRAETLGLKDRGEEMYYCILGIPNASSWDTIASATRVVERCFDTLLN